MLYEMLTGERPFKGRTATEVGSAILREPIVELPPQVPAGLRAISQRCLAKEPGERYQRAGEVRAALETLLSGATIPPAPSPEMVAASGSKEGLRPAIAWLCLAGVLAGVLVTALLNPRTQLWGRVSLEKPPEVQAEKARDILRNAGYSELPVDTASGFNDDIDYLRYVWQHDKTIERSDHVDPRAISFWYRQSPQALMALGFPPGGVSRSDPPLDTSGMALVSLDARGRLLALEAVPPQLEETPDSALPPDWGPLFAAAGLDPSKWSSTGPKWTPPYYCDTRVAWRGSLPNLPDTPIRVEAAAYRGKPVHFELIGPWTRAARMQPVQFTAGQQSIIVIVIVLLVAIVLGSATLAWRNLRLGMGDRKGVFRLATFVFGVLCASWITGAHHVAGPSEVFLLMLLLSEALFAASFVGTLYVALEPHVRRRWPVVLVTWNRLMAGQVRDPLLGRDILFGCVGGAACVIVRLLGDLFAAWPGFALRCSFCTPPRLPYSSAGGIRSPYCLV